MSTETGNPTATRRELAPGVAIPPLIIGCWQLAVDHRGELDRDAVVDRLLGLAEAGFDTFDAADIYTGVEKLLGRLRRTAEAASTRPRIRVHTKIVPDLRDLPDLRGRDLEEIVDRSRRRLDVETLDLVQFHWWDFEIPGWIEAAGKLDDLRREGKIRHLGVTNFDAAHLTPLLDAGIEVVSNQVQYSLLDRRPENDLLPLCEQRGIRLLCYGTLAGGFLTDRWLGREDPGSRPGNRSLVKYRLVIEELGGWPPFQRLLSTLVEIGEDLEIDPAQLAMRWVLDRPRVAAVIAGFSRRSRIDHYRKLLRLDLGPGERERLETVLADLGTVPGPVYGVERDPTGPHMAAMKTNLQRSVVNDPAARDG